MAQDVISELAVADSAISLLMHDDTISLEIRGKLSLLTEQVRTAAVPAKRFIMRSRAQGYVRVVHFYEVFSDMSQLFRRLLSQNIDLQMELPADLWPTRLNIAHFEEAFITLVIRARDALPNGGTLLIQATNVDEQISRSISGLCLSGDHTGGWICAKSEISRGTTFSALVPRYVPEGITQHPQLHVG